MVSHVTSASGWRGVAASLLDHVDEERELLSDHEFSDPDDYIDNISEEGTYKF